MKIQKIETCHQEKMFFKEHESLEFVEDTIGFEEKMINLYPNIVFQEIVGFGGAFTDSAGYCLNKLDSTMYQRALEEYFSSSGLNYTLCRTHINSCDFSVNTYSYLEDPKVDIFSIERDQENLIPMIKAAQKINPKLQLLASPWSPPAFMKSNKNMCQGGKLLEEYKQAWANYLVNYLNHYEKEGISIRYMTIQNEPKAVQTWESCIYSSEEEANLISSYLYPTLKKHNKEIKLFIWDHNKERLFERADSVLRNPNAKAKTDGVAFHWYSGDHFEAIEMLRTLYPNHLLFATEGCTGYSHFRPDDEVKNAEIYGHDYLGNLNAGANGQIDWNLFLDYQGGPNHKNNFCNSPIMLNQEANNYIKNLSYYYIGHFTKYIKPGAKRIGYSKYSNQIEVTTFKNTDQTLTAVVLNTKNKQQDFCFRLNNMLYHDTIKPHSILTYQIWEW